MQFSDSTTADAHPHLAAAKRIGIRALIGSGIALGGALLALVALPVIVVGATIYGYGNTFLPECTKVATAFTNVSRDRGGVGNSFICITSFHI